MIKVAKAMTDAEATAAAAYFSSLTPQKLYTVVEAADAPKVHVYNWAYMKDEPEATEPLGGRIVEIPKETERFEARDNRVEFMVYAPVGSLARGKAIVETGGGKTTACTACHGTALTGPGPYIPPIAGRSPTVMFRQLHDFQHGERSGPWSPADGRRPSPTRRKRHGWRRRLPREPEATVAAHERHTCVRLRDDRISVGPEVMLLPRAGSAYVKTGLSLGRSRFFVGRAIGRKTGFHFS